MTSNGTGSVNVETDVVLGKAGGEDLLGDIYKPPAALNKRTAVIHLYGGGFTSGNRIQAGDAAQKYAERGYLGITCWYRLADQDKWPAQVHDAKTAIRYARANADKLDIDKNKIVIAGYSAGGHLAIVVAGTQNNAELEGDGGNPGAGTQVAACVVYYAPLRMPRPAGGGDHAVMRAGASDADYVAASPATYLKEGFPPTIVIQSTADTLVPFSNTEGIFKTLRDANVPVEEHLFDGLSHVFDRHDEFGSACAMLVDLFLDRHVADPREYPQFVRRSRTEIGTPAPDPEPIRR